MMLTFHRSLTPGCSYPNRAVLSLPASQLHFCCVQNTSSLLLSERCPSWRDSIPLWGREETNIEKKPKTTTKETAAAWFYTDSGSICRSPWRNGWVSLNHTEQSNENGFHHLALPFMTGQGHSRGKTKFAGLLLPSGLYVEREACSRCSTMKGPWQSCWVNHISGCSLVSLSAQFVLIFPLAVAMESFCSI